MKNTTPCGVIGDGRMARHFTAYLKMSGLPFRQWSRRMNTEDPAEYLKGCRAVLLLISDGSIKTFIDENPKLKVMNPVHFSGSLYLEEIPSIHPLMTFSTNLYSLEKYRSIPFIHEQGRMSLENLFPELPNHSEAIDSNQKTLYHSLCVLSGNFTTMLWQKTFEDFSGRLQLDRELLLPYMEQTFENLKTDWKNALTGPLARKDQQTIEKNLQALEGDPFADVYRSFANTVYQEGKYEYSGL